MISDEYILPIMETAVGFLPRQAQVLACKPDVLLSPCQRHGTLAVVRGSAANGRPLDIFGTQQSGAYRKRALECEGAQGRVVRRGCGSFAFEYICGIRTRLCAGQSLRYTQRDLRACISQLLEGCQPQTAVFCFQLGD